MKLTEDIIKELKPGAKMQRIADDGSGGLSIEIRPSGKKIFMFRFQWNKKPQGIIIGRYPSITLDEAREIALTYRNSVNNNADPRRIKNRSINVISKQKYESPAFVDNFFRYLLNDAIHIPMNKLYNELKNTYIKKLKEYGLVDMLDIDLQKVIK